MHGEMSTEQEVFSSVWLPQLFWMLFKLDSKIQSYKFTEFQSLKSDFLDRNIVDVVKC